MREGAASELRRLPHEVAVRGRTDADGKQPARVQLFANNAEQFILVAHLAVRQEDHLPQVCGGGRALERHLQGRKNLRASVGSELLNIVDRLAECVRLYRLRL